MLLLDDLIKLISLLVVLSVAAERLVEILKGFLFKNLNTADPDPDKETLRQAKVQLLAVIALLVPQSCQGGGSVPSHPGVG